MRPGKTVAILALLMLSHDAAIASMPSVAELDATARATGNLRTLAVSIGDRVFATRWPAEVTQVSANGINRHIIVGVRISGVKFHRPLDRAGFEAEVRRLISLCFAADPGIEEVDVWASVPIVVGRDVVVSGDLAIPTSRPVFTLSARRGDLLQERTFWDEEWARTAFKQGK
ncbi:MAG TPA: hypothetical protein VIN40_00765 [Candidatus Tyrphobacter sp.]